MQKPKQNTKVRLGRGTETAKTPQFHSENTIKTHFSHIHLILLATSMRFVVIFPETQQENPWRCREINNVKNLLFTSLSIFSNVAPIFRRSQQHFQVTRRDCLLFRGCLKQKNVCFLPKKNQLRVVKLESFERRIFLL